MRILYIITQGEQGGGQKNVLDLAIGMKKKGHEVYIAVGEIENEGDKWLQIQLVRNKIPLINIFEIKSLQREINIYKDLQAVWETKTLIGKIKPDILHLHSSKAGVVGGLACFLYNATPRTSPTTPSHSSGRRGIRTIYTVHGFVFLEPMNSLKKIAYIFLEFISSRCRDFTILISEVDINSGKKYWILLKQKYKLIYNGVDAKIATQMLPRQTARKYFLEHVPPTPFGKMYSPIVGTISNLYKTKGLEFLIDAAKKVVSEKNNTLFVVMGFGDQDYKKQLEQRIKENNLENNFFLLGRTESAFKYLKGLDLFTLTSVKEGLPYTLLEAKIAGVPILASRVGGIPEIAKKIPMALVDVGNVEEISKKILENLNLIQNSGNENGKLPEIYSMENMIKNTEKVYINLLTKS